MGDGHFQEELGRRTIEISGLREDLAEAWQRVEEGKERNTSLHETISKLKAEINVRIQKAAELADHVRMEEAEGRDAAANLAAAEESQREELARLRQAAAEHKDAQAVAQLEADAKHQRAERLQVEAASVRARIEACRRDAEQTRDDLAKEAVHREKRKAELVQKERARAERHKIDAEAKLTVLASDTAAVQAELAQMQANLTMEKECSAGLDTALRHTVEKRSSAQQECEALSRELGRLEANAAQVDTRQALEASRSQYQKLTLEAAASRREALLQTQSLQGAIDETRRMMRDHQKDQEMQLEETRRCPESSPLAALMAALVEARQEAERAAQGRQASEAKRQAAEAHRARAEGALASERERASQAQLVAAEAELAEARRALEAVSCRAVDAQARAVRSEGAVADVRRRAKQDEATLRSKLEELWRAIATAKRVASRDEDTFSMRSGSLLSGFSR